MFYHVTRMIPQYQNNLLKEKLNLYKQIAKLNMLDII